MHLNPGRPVFMEEAAPGTVVSRRTRKVYHKPWRFETCRKCAFRDGICNTFNAVAQTMVFEHSEKGAGGKGILGSALQLWNGRL